jgi:hypothetical protein
VLLAQERGQFAGKKISSPNGEDIVVDDTRLERLKAIPFVQKYS